MPINQPTLLLAHGAWHPPHLYQPFKDALAKRGYTLIVPALPTMGKEARGVILDADIQALLDAAEPLFAEGKEVILVAHSYGGIPATVATRNNSTTERKVAGKTGGFKHIAYIAAFAIPVAGLSNLTAVPGGQWMPWHKLIVDSQTPGGKGDKIEQLFLHEDLAKPLLYNDLPDKAADHMFAQLVPQSYAATVQPLEFAVADVTIPKTYIVCEKDAAFPVPLQKHLASGFGFVQKSVSGGHSAFASVPDELAEVLIQIAEGKD
ncbi:alpha/beta-hydrolase [Rhypophila sp. PSN 637]